MSQLRMQGAKRNLVRWTDDLDKKLLLCIQFACSEAGLRIPWENVAKLMGEKVSEGAIVQHLAKLRSKMLELRLDVPPPLKRIPATAPSKIYAESGNNRGRPVPSVTASVAKPATAARRTGKKKTRARRSGLNSDSDSQSDVKNMEIADDTDDEWGTVSDRKRRKLKGKQRQLAEPEAFHEPAPELTVDHTNDISTRQSPPPHEQTAQFALRRQLAGGTRQLGWKHDSANYNGDQNTRESGSSEASDIDAATPKMNAMVTRAADSGDGVEQVTTSNVRTFGRPQLTNSPTRDIERREYEAALSTLTKDAYLPRSGNHQYQPSGLGSIAPAALRGHTSMPSISSQSLNSSSSMLSSNGSRVFTPHSSLDLGRSSEGSFSLLDEFLTLDGPSNELATREPEVEVAGDAFWAEQFPLMMSDGHEEDDMLNN